MPSNATLATVTNNTLPSGVIWTFTIPAATVFSVVNGAIVNSTFTPAAATSAAGTFGWWALSYNLSGSTSVIASDPIGAPGSGSIVTVSNLSPANGEIVTASFNLTYA